MSGNDDQSKGKMEELKGRGKQAWGSMSDDQKAQAEGKGEELKGKAKQKAGEMKDKFDKE